MNFVGLDGDFCRQDKAFFSDWNSSFAVQRYCIKLPKVVSRQIFFAIFIRSVLWRGWRG